MHRVTVHRYESHPLARLSGTEPTITRMKLQLLGDPHIQIWERTVFLPEWKRTNRTTFPALCLEWNEKPIEPARVLVNIRGRYIESRVGELIETVGIFRSPSAPANPGEFDYRQWMQQQRYVGSLWIDLSEQIQPLREQRFLWNEPIVCLRTSLQDVLKSSINNPESSAIASALILGDRSDLPEDVKRQFINSGTFHLLAISGLHIVLLAGVLSMFLNLLNLAHRTKAWLLIVFFLVYLLVTGMRPSVFRATLFLCIFLSGGLLHRSTNLSNALGLTGLILLVWNPLLLFESGTQLSFLSVAAILLVSPFLREVSSYKSVQARAMRGLSMSWLQKVKHALKIWVFNGCLMGGAIALVTFPVMAGSFHLWPMYGIPLTIFLIPLVCAALLCGILLLMSSLVSSTLVEILGSVLENTLLFWQSIVNTVGLLPGHAWTLPHLPAWWFIGYLALVTGLCILPQARKSLWLILVCWVVLQLGLSRVASTTTELRVTTYAVGHGLAILLEMPGGERFLYDCGSDDGGERAARVVLGDLRLRGIDSIDRLYLSHADLDHYSAWPRLSQQTSIREVVTTQAVMDSPEENLKVLRAFFAEQDVSLRIVSAGDSEVFSQGCEIQICHPNHENYATDNEASLVILLKYAGRTFLLTGDVEEQGLIELMSLTLGSVDWLLAPHHGSRVANRVEFANWCKPSHVIVSAGSRSDVSYLKEIYSDSKELHATHSDGAIIFRVSPDGRLHWRHWRNQSSVSN